MAASSEQNTMYVRGTRYRLCPFVRKLLTVLGCRGTFGATLSVLQIMVSTFVDEQCDTSGRPGYKIASAAEGDDGHRRLEHDQDDSTSWWWPWESL
jgi:hypothetical protein